MNTHNIMPACSYLEDCDREGVFEMEEGRQDHPTMAPAQVTRADYVQLGVGPEQLVGDVVCERTNPFRHAIEA